MKNQTQVQNDDIELNASKQAAYQYALRSPIEIRREDPLPVILPGYETWAWNEEDFIKFVISAVSCAKTVLWKEIFDKIKDPFRKAEFGKLLETANLMSLVLHASRKTSGGSAILSIIPLVGSMGGAFIDSPTVNARELLIRLSSPLVRHSGDIMSRVVPGLNVEQAALLAEALVIAEACEYREGNTYDPGNNFPEVGDINNPTVIQKFAWRKRAEALKSSLGCWSSLSGGLWGFRGPPTKPKLGGLMERATEALLKLLI
jgi:hypothetical protein